MFREALPQVTRLAHAIGLDLQGTVVSLDGVYDCRKNRKAIFNRGMVPNINANPTSPTEGVGRRQAAEILGMQLQRSALQGMSAQSTSRLFRVVIFGGG
jgi:hypothetical protein